MLELSLCGALSVVSDAIGARKYLKTSSIRIRKFPL